MILHRSLLGCVCTLSFVMALTNLVGAEPEKKPGPAHEKLALATGRWKSEVERAESPLGPGFHTTGVAESRMVYNGFFFETRGSFELPAGKVEYLEIIGYDEALGKYRSGWFDSLGMMELGDVTSLDIQGNSWTFSWTEPKNGKTYQVRQVVTFDPSYKTSTWLSTYSEDGITWKHLSKGKAKRTKAFRR